MSELCFSRIHHSNKFGGPMVGTLNHEESDFPTNLTPHEAVEHALSKSGGGS